VTADLVSRAFFGSAPFFAQIPHDLAVTHPSTYLLIAVLGVAAGLIGFSFKTVLYKSEDLVDRLWRGRPEWARPAVGGLGLGALLIALPQMYGVGYPVMNQMVAGQVVLWLLVVLMVGKMVATSLTLSIGGSGGVFAPSLFTGAAAGMAFGVVVEHLFGPGVGAPAVFAVVGMGAVFSAAAQAPLTATASVVEMTGNFGLTLPVMLATGIAAAVSKSLSYGSIYTTKLLRRGVDIERPRPASMWQTLTVADVMQPVAKAGGEPLVGDGAEGAARLSPVAPKQWLELIGTVTDTGQPQALLANETLEQALRQLTLYGRVGLPVLSTDRQQLRGWITRRQVLRALSRSVSASARDVERGAAAADFGFDDPSSRIHVPTNPLTGYETIEVSIGPRSPALGKRLDDVLWPPGCLVVAVTEGRELAAPRGDAVLRAGERVIILAPTAHPPVGPSPTKDGTSDEAVGNP
jgi:CIC family chloride channel protein